jgi:WD40 repeat protein
LPATRSIKLWSLPGGKEIATLRGHGAGISDIDFNPDVTRLVSCSRTDGTIKLWDVVDGEEILTLTGDVFPERVCFTPDGKQLACRGGSRLTFRDGNFENELPRLVHGAPLSDLTVQPADALVTARDINGQTVTWDLRPGGDLISRPGSFELRRQGNGVRIVARTPYAPGFSLWPEDHSRRARAAATWHAEQARAAEQQQDWYGAAFHVSQLARHQFWDHALHHRAADLWLRAAQPRKAALHHAWQAWQTTNSADHSR